MKILSFESSAVSAAVCLTDGEKLIASAFQNCGLTHSRTLLPMAEQLLANVGLTAREVDGFAVASGPGSFTGIRIGISAAKGFALASGKPLMPLTAFELVAYNVNDGDFFAVTDAAHGHFYACRCTCRGGELKFGEPVYIPGEELAACGLALYGFQQLALPRYTRLDAGECLLPAVRKKLACGAPFGEMHALYIRKSQAEEGRR